MVNIRPLNPELQKKAIEELNEDPARIEKDLQVLREWIKKSPHLKARDDDQFLIAFLRGCKYSMEKVKLKFDMFFTLKTHTPDFTRNRSVKLNPKLHDALKKGVGVPLPKLEAPDAPRYFLIRPGAYDPSVNPAQDIMKVAQMIGEMLLMEDDNYVIAGQIGILDFSGVGISHFTQFGPTFIKKFTMLSQDANPVRQKGQHFVNMPSIALAVFNLFQSFTNEKNKQRVYVHGHDMEALYKVVPRKLLPSEYGGEAGPIQSIIDDLEKRVIAFDNYFVEDEKFGVDEKKRVGRPKNSESLFGIEGSFRQLAID